MFCKNCGNEVKDGEKFCSKCGTSQQIGNTNPSSVGNIPPQTNNTQQIPLFTQPIGSSTVSTMPPKNNKKLHLIIGIAAGVIALVIIVLVIALAGASGDTSSKADTFSVESVKESYIEGYSSMTVGEAFEDTFFDTSWDYDDNYVEFTGSFYADSGDEIMLDIIFEHDASDKSDPLNYTISADDSTLLDLETGDYTYLLGDEFHMLFDYIYYGDTFEWIW